MSLGERSAKRLSVDVYEEIAAGVDSRLKEIGLDPRLSAWIAGFTVKKIAEMFAGAQAYFPKDMKKRLEIRDEMIFVEIEEIPLADLAEKYGLTEMRIRQIVWAMNEAIRNAYNNCNLSYLAERYGISEARVNRILKEANWK